MLGGKAAGYDLLRQTGAKEENRPLWRQFRTVLGSKTCSFLSPGQKRNCERGGAEKFSALSHVLSQTPARSHAAGFGGMTLITDEPTGVNWNGATANERERMGIEQTFDVML